jgi:hypothetical protein
MLLAAVALASSLWAQAPSLVREGSQWVETSSGQFACPIKGRVQVAVTGDLAIRGQLRDQCQYWARRRVRASNESAARARLGTLSIRTRTSGDTGFLQLTSASSAAVEVEILVPKTVREVQAGTESGRTLVRDITGSVSVENSSGGIELDQIQGAVEARTMAGPVNIGRIQGTLNCWTGGGEVRVQFVAGESACDTGGGNIWIGEAGGPAKLFTAGGNIEVVAANGSVQARSRLGLIDIDKAGGVVYAQTQGGSIQVGQARGVKAESTNGTIRVKSADGPLRLNTARGSILVELLGPRPAEESFLGANGGDITVLVPSNVAVTVEARNETPGYRGKIVSDYPQLRVSNVASGTGQMVAEGMLNGGGKALRVIVNGGNIYLRKPR